MPSKDLAKIDSRFRLLIVYREAILKLTNMAVFEYFAVHCAPLVFSFDPKVCFRSVARLSLFVNWGDVLTEKVVHLMITVDTACRAALLRLGANHNLVWDHV